MAAGVVIGYQATHKASPEPAIARALTEQPKPVAVAPPPATPQPAVEDLRASFLQLAAALPADVGVAVSAGDQTSSYGEWTSGAAWSTIKVPLSIAALRKDALAAEPYVSRAIAQSDNSAADQMWALLGTPAEAGTAVQTVLAEGGDPEVRVQTEQVRPPYSPFGQTQWSLPQAAQFAFRLQCLQAEPVLSQMKSLASDQQWGLAGDGAAVKGGWGPEPDGGYLVRQIALVGDGPETFGVALAAKPTDGSFATGTAMLDKLSEWVLDHREQMPKGSCGG
ncbi:hypothetical protein [Mycobacterium sp. ITM-2016-00318]|uniref:hypothetical protein n=1 Tax=Mycobacterium sp. ITM-2016-00318 TaxID=2099693 RepID=UPI001E54185D|nr:hypothetical protein [Mycobacterium sp. ITM-2016-00318]WNG93678.1 hypothetical protein C6A82_004195 [Mycobacterium sp. ITM-2016-00318]